MIRCTTTAGLVVRPVIAAATTNVQKRVRVDLAILPLSSACPNFTTADIAST